MKTKKILLIVALSFTFLNSALMTSSFADETVSAPPVVAPAQPVSAASAVVSTNAASSSVSVPAQQQPSLMGMALPFVIMLTIMYFLMIRPQQKKSKEHQTLISQLKSGDEVITSSGIIGTVAGLSEKVVTLEVSKNVQLKILKSQVNQVVKGSIQELQA